MKNLAFILVLILLANIAFAQVQDKKSQKIKIIGQTTQKRTTVQQKSNPGIKNISKRKIVVPAKSPEEMAMIMAFNWIALFKNYGNFYTPETIKHLSTLDLSTGSPVLNGIARTTYMCDDSLVHLQSFLIWRT